MLFEKCPLCGSYKNSKVYDFTDDYKIVKCENCNHFYTKISKEIELEKFYSEGDYAEYDSQDSIFEKIIDFENLRILKKIEKLTSEKKILDFGCGKGKFLKIAKSRNWDTFGIETSLIRANYAKNNYGLLISNEYYKTGKIGMPPYNVITLFHVLEHIENPDNLILNLVNNNLASDGILLIEVPNIMSLQSKFAGPNWLHIDIPRHLNHFTLERLIPLVEKNDMKIIKIEYYHNIHGILGMLGAIFQLVGYKKNIMSELKYRKKLFLIISILILLPISFVLESFASIFKRGSVLRIFAIKNL